MNAKDIRKLAADPRFIPGIYNYCDRWCERCPLSHRCLNYAMERAQADDDPAARDLSNRKFWDKLQGVFRQTMKMIREEARERGIDLDSPAVRAETRARERAGRRREAKHRPLTRAAMVYARAVGKWMENARPLFAAKGVELETKARLELGDVASEAAHIAELVEVIRWYQYFVGAKVTRAISSEASEELETDEELRAMPKDSDGSAKVALMAMDRSISAWAGLREILGDDNILDLLVQLTRLRRETEASFPNARRFVRPGFDEPAR